MRFLQEEFRHLFENRVVAFLLGGQEGEAVKKWNDIIADGIEIVDLKNQTPSHLYRIVPQQRCC